MQHSSIWASQSSKFLSPFCNIPRKELFVWVKKPKDGVQGRHLYYNEQFSCSIGKAPGDDFDSAPNSLLSGDFEVYADKVEIHLGLLWSKKLETLLPKSKHQRTLGLSVLPVSEKLVASHYTSIRRIMVYLLIIG